MLLLLRGKRTRGYPLVLFLSKFSVRLSGIFFYTSLFEESIFLKKKLTNKIFCINSYRYQIGGYIKIHTTKGNCYENIYMYHVWLYPCR